MPSLRALEEFKTSFQNMGLEMQILEELGHPLDDLPLPDHEPAADPAFDEAFGVEMADGQDDAQLPEVDYSGLDLSELIPDETFPSEGYLPQTPSSEPQDASSPETEFLGDLSDLLGGIDVGGLSLDESPGGEDLGEPPIPDQGDIDFGNFIDTIPDDLLQDETPGTDAGTPPGLLNGFADEIEAERASPGEADASFFDEVVEEGREAFDFGDLDLDIPVEEVPLDAAPDAAAFDVPEPDGDLEEAPFDFSLPEDFSTSGDTEPEGGGFSALDLGDIDLGGGDDAAMELPGGDDAAMQLPGEDDSFDFGEEIQDFEAEAELEEISGDTGDTFDNFSPDSTSLADDFDIGGEDDFGSLDDFSIPGLDFEGKSPGKGPSKAEAKKNGFLRDGSDEVEEISLTVEELESVLETLASYPLNLRVACEELIAEKAVAPDQMSKLVKLLINGAPAGEAAALAGKVLDKTIHIPKGYEKKTGEDLEIEQSSFAYIFVHNFLPVLRLFMAIALVILSAGYLCWRYIYTPIRAEKIYKLGIERIEAGEYGRANERFSEAFRINPKKPWFFTYARAFREVRQYTLAEEKYQQLLNFTASKNKRYIPEKAAVLEYADFITYLGDYEKADRIIRRNIMDYFPFDRDGLLALGDNSLAWGEYETERLEDAREAYARLIERYGRSDLLLERMLKYFIRTDNLEQVLALQSHFMASAKRKISAAALAEMGGYFMDKRFERVRGVPNEYLDYIGGIREILLRAVQQDPMLPESYYHLARYYNYLNNSNDERLTLEVALRVFEAAREESAKRIGHHIAALHRYAEILIGGKEFFPAEENLVKGINLYQDGLDRRLLKPSPEFGRLYAELGDLEFFVKDGSFQDALDYYHFAEQNGWAPPEIQYRMGAAYYQMRQWGPALERLFAAYREMPQNRRILYALGNVSYLRGNYFAAQGYYDRLLEILDDDRARLPTIMPTDDEKQLDLAERLMVAQNNLGVALEALAERTGNSRYRSNAQGLYSDSARAWDVLTRNPNSMVRMRPSPEISAPGVNPAYLNIQNSLYPVSGYEPHFFLRIDKDVFEPSLWEDLVPPGYRLSEGIYQGR